MNFLQLKYFKKVAELEHITKAAEELYISQPALSKAIHLLEQEIGYPLFDRSGTGIQLNENGKILYHYTSTTLSCFDNTLTKIKDKNRQNTQVSLSITAATGFLSDIILSFKEMYPAIHLSIMQESFQQKEHHCDLYLRSSSIPLQEQNTITLLSEKCLLGISKENPLSQKSLITPEMLRHETFLTMQSHLPLYRITYDLCHDAGFIPNTNLQFENRETIFDLISANMGISIIPEKTWAPSIKHDNIILIPLTVSYARHIILQWEKGRYLSHSSKLLIAYLQKYFEQLSTCSCSFT